MISSEDERGVHELADTNEKRFRRLRLMIDRIVGTTINEQHTAFLDCMAWNRNRTSDECFTPGDVIILSGEYRSGSLSKQVSVSLQIQNIYVKGEISDFRFPLPNLLSELQCLQKEGQMYIIQEKAQNGA